ncbi:hypothetical protein F4859DRAFT_433064 [Xylaria cf. heliscus]|nr:hypothetical protein F4859DRAFT_433064 [Xylaria cf. heliscus]
MVSTTRVVLVLVRRCWHWMCSLFSVWDGLLTTHILIRPATTAARLGCALSGALELWRPAYPPSSHYLACPSRIYSTFRISCIDRVGQSGVFPLFCILTASSPTRTTRLLSTSSAPKTDVLVVESSHHLRQIYERIERRKRKRGKIFPHELEVRSRDRGIAGSPCNEIDPSPLSPSAGIPQDVYLSQYL